MLALEVTNRYLLPNFGLWEGLRRLSKTLEGSQL